MRVVYIYTPGQFSHRCQIHLDLDQMSGQRNGRQGGDGGGKGLQVEAMVESRAPAAEEKW